MRLVLLLAVLALAGCAAPAATESPADAAAGAPAAAPEPRTERAQGMVTASAESPTGGFVFPQAGLVIKVPAEGGSLLMEMRWDRPEVELGLSHYTPSDGPTRLYDEKAGDGALRIELGDAEVGKHSFRVGAKAGAGATFDLRVTAFPGPVPEGWTAFTA